MAGGKDFIEYYLYSLNSIYSTLLYVAAKLIRNEVGERRRAKKSSVIETGGGAAHFNCTLFFALRLSITLLRICFAAK